MKTIVPRLKQTFVFLMLFLITSFTNSYSQNTFDGNYCPGPNISGDEYSGQLTTGPLSNSAKTCEISQVWAKVENEKGLSIDFKLIGSNFQGQPKQLGVTNINFGIIFTILNNGLYNSAHYVE